jgi:hypothetical protein
MSIKIHGFIHENTLEHHLGSMERKLIDERRLENTLEHHFGSMERKLIDERRLENTLEHHFGSMERKLIDERRLDELFCFLFPVDRSAKLFQSIPTSRSDRCIYSGVSSEDALFALLFCSVE